MCSGTFYFGCCRRCCHLIGKRGLEGELLHADDLVMMSEKTERLGNKYRK